MRRSADSLQRIVHSYTSAFQNLSEYVEGHVNDPVRQLRTLSERAALQLVFGGALALKIRQAWLSEFARQQAPLDVDGLLGESSATLAQRSIENAERDLGQCLALDARLGERTDQLRTLATIRRQYTVNIASAALLRRLIGMGAGHRYGLSPRNQTMVEAVRDIYRDLNDVLHAAAKCELMAILVLAGDPHTDLKAALRNGLPENTLMMDRRVIRLVDQEHLYWAVSSDGLKGADQLD